MGCEGWPGARVSSSCRWRDCRGCSCLLSGCKCKCGARPSSLLWLQDASCSTQYAARASRALNPRLPACPSEHCRRNPDAFSPEGEALGLPAYTFSQPIPSDPVLSLALQLEAARLLGAEGVCSGLNATADSFYSSQGRCVYVRGGGGNRVPCMSCT